MDSTRTLTLTDFLLARIAEDEAAVREVTARDPILPGDRAEWFADMDDLRVAVSPKRGLAECAAKRQIVEGMRATADIEGGGYENAVSEALRYLAAVYADHPDYDPEWAL